MNLRLPARHAPGPARRLTCPPPPQSSQPRPHFLRTVAARDRKLTGRSTETIRHESGNGGSYNNHGSTGGGGGGGHGGGGGDGGGGGSDESHPRRLLLLAALKWAAAAALAAAALVAAAPAVLSHPAGLRVVLAAVNLACPLALSVHLDAAQLGWQQPLQLRGLRLVERGSSGSGGSAAFDYSSSDDEEPLPPQPPGAQLDGPPAGGRVQPSGRLRGLRRRGVPAPAADDGKAAADGAVGSSRRRRRTLISVERISTTRTLWQLLRGGDMGELLALHRGEGWWGLLSRSVV